MKVSGPVLFPCEDMINVSEIHCVVSQRDSGFAHRILDRDLLEPWV
jgi:hypothetical protein